MEFLAILGMFGPGGPGAWLDIWTFGPNVHMSSQAPLKT